MEPPVALRVDKAPVPGAWKDALNLQTASTHYARGIFKTQLIFLNAEA